MCTDGGKGSSDPATDVGGLAVRRAAEAAEAGELLGMAGQECLGYPDGELDDDAGLREALVAAVRRLRPGIVLCPDPTAVFFGQDYFNHRDHRITGLAALDAVAPAAALPHYFPEPARPTRWRRCSCRAPSSPTCGSTSRRRSTSRARRWAVTGASSPTGWSGRRPRCGWAPRTPVEQAGVPCAEGFRRLRLGG